MKTLIMKGMRKVYQTFNKKEYPRWAWPSSDDWTTTNKLLFNLLSAPQPCLVARLGTVEGQIVHNKLTITPPDC